MFNREAFQKSLYLQLNPTQMRIHPTGSAERDKIAQNIAQQLKSNDEYFKSQNISVQSPYPQQGHFPIYHHYN